MQEAVPMTLQYFPLELYHSYASGQIVSIAPQNADVILSGDLFVTYGALAPLAVGSTLYGDKGAVLRIIERNLLSSFHSTVLHAIPCCRAEVLTPIIQKNIHVHSQRSGVTAAWITLSDKGAVGMREDESGPEVKSLLCNFLPITLAQGFILPDAPNRVQALVADLAHHQGYDIIITTGGTGVSPRDTTPEAVAPLLERRLPGFEHVMMSASLQKTSNAAVSRALAGTLGMSIVICLPGSKKAVEENLAAVLPALAHALQKLQGDTADCAHPVL